MTDTVIRMDPSPRMPPDEVLIEDGRSIRRHLKVLSDRRDPAGKTVFFGMVRVEALTLDEYVAWIKADPDYKPDPNFVPYEEYAPTA